MNVVNILFQLDHIAKKCTRRQNSSDRFVIKWSYRKIFFVSHGVCNKSDFTSQRNEKCFVKKFISRRGYDMCKLYYKCNIFQQSYMFGSNLRNIGYTTLGWLLLYEYEILQLLKNTFLFKYLFNICLLVL